MIFLDWLLRFHPIIIILLQSRSTWTPEAWLRRKLWLCVSQVSVALPAPIVTWSHARGQGLSSNIHLTPRRKCLVHTGHCTAVSDITCLHIDTHADHKQATEPCPDHVRECRVWMLDAWWNWGRLESAVTSPRSIWLSVTISMTRIVRALLLVSK